MIDARLLLLGILPNALHRGHKMLGIQRLALNINKNLFDVQVKIPGIIFSSLISTPLQEVAKLYR